MLTGSRQVLDAIQTALSGQYAIEREIGSGGMATVYLAQDIVRNTPVALKILNAELTASIAADRFVREIQVATALEHPNVVGVLDSGSLGGTLYYVMPFVKGATLRDRLDQVRQLPIDEVVRLATDVAGALDHAHARGVIHRDIKPENILLGEGRAMIADFGIATAVATAGGERLTRTGMVVGTPLYMSPEQAAGSGAVTAQSDIYSLACVVYEMLAGQPPFSGATPAAILARHSLDVPPRLGIVRPTVPPGMEAAIARALAKVPADRFSSAGEFARAMANPRASATSANLPKRIGRWAGVAGAGVLLAGAAATTLMSRPDDDGLPRNHLAVLYLEDRGEGRTLQPIATGLTEALINQLSEVPQLRVISRNGVAPYRDSTLRLDSIATRLGTGTIVTGSVTPLPRERVRIAVEMVEPDGNQVGRTQVDVAVADVLGIPDSTAAAISRFLRRRIGQNIRELESRTGTRSSLAWSLMQQARGGVSGVEALVRSRDVPGALAQIRDVDSLFATVERADPSWTEPIVERAWLGYRAARLVPYAGGGREHTDVGLRHAQRALDKDGADHDALEARGTLRYWTWLNNGAPNPAAASELLANAEADLAASTRGARPRASAWSVLSHLRINKGELARAKLDAETAYNADPYMTNVDQTLHRLFTISLDLGSRDEAEKWCTEGASRFPGTYRFVACKLWLFALPAHTPPRPEEIWGAYDAFVRSSPANMQAFDALKGRLIAAMGLVRAGLADSAKSVAARSQGDRLVDPRGELLHLAAIVHAHAGDTDAALSNLAAHLAINPHLRASAPNDQSWWFNDLRKDPRYQALLR